MALDIEPKLLFDFEENFFIPIPEEKENEIHELISMLRSKDIRQIQMIKKIYIEIISAFQQK